ncbi:antibiotic biosynthesis monooxygenase family protein [Virgibacillus kimchii]
MKAFMTNGTEDFLKKLMGKHPKINFHFMKNANGALSYYEGENKKVFSAGRQYEVVIQTGEFQEEGYVVMNNITVTKDGRAPFEDRFKRRKNKVEDMPGFQAFRFLRPKKGNTYVVMTQWNSVSDFENWKESDQFKKAHKDQSTKPPAYFADKPFITTYHMRVEEEETE